MTKTQIFPPADKVGLKEQNIKSIDDRIGNIMKKYEKKDEPAKEKMPLGPKDLNLETFTPQNNLMEFNS